MNAPEKAILLALLIGSLVGGCSLSPKRPEDLPAPAQITCVTLPTRMIFSTARDHVSDGVHYEVRLEKGPYISEKEDERGTYYRAPPGALSIGPLMAWGVGGYHDSPGGFWIPHDPTQSPQLYVYETDGRLPAIEEPMDYGDCSSYNYAQDPKTTKVSLVPYAVGGALGGAAGGAIARALVPKSGIGYGQAVAGGAVGGATGMLLVGAIIESGIGKIHFDYPTYSHGFDPRLGAQLRELAARAVPLKKRPFPEMQPAAAVATKP